MEVLFITGVFILTAISAVTIFMLRNAIIKNDKLEAHTADLEEQLILAFEVVASREAYIEVVNQQLKGTIADVKEADVHKFYEQDELMSVVFDQYVSLSKSLDEIVGGYSNELKIK